MELGEGQYSRVFALDDNIAIKRIYGDYFPTAVREIIMLTICRHANIVPLIEVALNGDTIHLHMWRSQMSLYDYVKMFSYGKPDINQKPPITLGNVMSICKDVLMALAYIHAQGVIHGDVKPANVLIDVADGIPFARICDFGLSQFADAKHKAIVIQTANFRAPELFATRNYSTAVDIWSFGCLAYYLLCGKCFVSQSTEEGINPARVICAVFGIYGGVHADLMHKLALIDAAEHREIIITRMGRGDNGCGLVDIICGSLVHPRVRKTANELLKMIKCPQVSNVIMGDIVLENQYYGWPGDKDFSPQAIRFANMLYNMLPLSTDLLKFAALEIADIIYPCNYENSHPYSQNGLLSQAIVDVLGMYIKK